MKKPDKITKTVKIDAAIAPLFEYMLKKASVQFSDINDTFIKLWISQNLDLLNESEKKQFKIY